MRSLDIFAAVLGREDDCGSSSSPHAAPRACCIYGAPSEEMVREHAQRLGDHSVVAIYEIAGDVTPDDFPLD